MDRSREKGGERLAGGNNSSGKMEYLTRNHRWSQEERQSVFRDVKWRGYICRGEEVGLFQIAKEAKKEEL